jgi:hypothetical protein
MKKIDREKFYDEIQQIIISYGNEDDLAKIEFVKNFMKELLKVDDLENISMILGCIGTKPLFYLFVCLLIEYENTNENSKEKYLKYNNLKNVPSDILKKIKGKKGKVKKIEKDTVCIEVKVEDVYPIEEFTVDEVKFIENILDKTDIDLEYDKDIIISTKQLLHLMTGIMREYDTYLARKKFKDLSEDLPPEKVEY